MASAERRNAFIVSAGMREFTARKDSLGSKRRCRKTRRDAVLWRFLASAARKKVLELISMRGGQVGESDNPWNRVRTETGATLQVFRRANYLIAVGSGFI
jgi:hypothetical protein